MVQEAGKQSYSREDESVRPWALKHLAEPPRVDEGGKSLFFSGWDRKDDDVMHDLAVVRSNLIVLNEAVHREGVRNDKAPVVIRRACVGGVFDGHAHDDAGIAEVNRGSGGSCSLWGT